MSPPEALPLMTSAHLVLNYEVEIAVLIR